MLRVGKLIECPLFGPEMMSCVEKDARGPGGGTHAFIPCSCSRCWCSSRLHGLADDATSFQLTDRNSFRAFLGLTAADHVPDGQTIADFREALVEKQAFERLFALFLEHLLQRHGLGLGKERVMIDATFVVVPRPRNRREQNAIIKQAVVQQEFSDHPAVGAHKDCDARWTKKKHETYYGYKDHVKVDVTGKGNCRFTHSSSIRKPTGG